MSDNTQPVDEPTGDEVPDGTQLPTTEDLPAEEGDAGIGDVELEEADDAGDLPLSSYPD